MLRRVPCPHAGCDQLNDATARFCARCGRALVPPQRRYGAPAAWIIGGFFLPAILLGSCMLDRGPRAAAPFLLLAAAFVVIGARRGAFRRRRGYWQ
jgi:hypothetical protein